MSGKRISTDSSLEVTLTALKEAQMEISAGESWVGKIFELAMEIVNAAQVLDLLAVQSDASEPGTVERIDPRIKTPDDLRNGQDDALATEPHSTPASTRCPRVPTSASLTCDGSMSQLVGTTNVITGDPTRVETTNDLRRILSTSSGVNVLLALEEESAITRTIDLLQMEVRSARPHSNLSGYLKDCAVCLEALVNKHHALPASLLINDVTKEGTQPCNGGGFSVRVDLSLLKASPDGHTKDIWKGSYGTQAVCLKVLRLHAQGGQQDKDKLVKAFHREALLWTRLSHSNLLPLIGVNTTVFPHGFCLVSPWMMNGDVISFLEKNPDHDRLAAIMEISAGITYLHDSAIVHGDIKGANVLVDERGQCRLADFGLAFTVSESTTLVQSCTSDVKGSIRWMAPELFRFSDGSRQDMEDGHERTNKFGRDIYAFACTILEIITGKPPFADLMPSDVMVILEVGTRNSRPPRPLPEIYWCPDNVWALVQQCWAERSQDRPKASEVYGFLLKLIPNRDPQKHVCEEKGNEVGGFLPHDGIDYPKGSYGGFCGGIMGKTLQDIKDFAQRRADRAIWKLYLSARSDFDRIQGLRERIREALDVLTGAQSNIATLEAIEQKDPQTEIQDRLGARSDALSCQSMDRMPHPASNSEPHSSLPLTHGPILFVPSSSSCDGSTGQFTRTTDVNAGNSLRIETVDDLRRMLSTNSAVNTLLTLKEGPLIARTVDLLQLVSLLFALTGAMLANSIETSIGDLFCEVGPQPFCISQTVCDMPGGSCE
ncbi:hypothetical protein AAF712_003408 [Marasmius tenuissimus]|uniref:Protein kinase domain-containing protein n=1 Tax=Marasmius tenuissimus TaxID=585030 RepID=A0ABR3A786_9AGAR